MPRPRRASPAGLVFHVINRAAKKTRLFDTISDYEAFQQVLSFAVSRFDIALFAYSIMPNHWHFVLSSCVDGELSRFMHWLTTTHARRWQLARGVDGQGAVYQGRFKSIPIETERYFLWVCRYVERNALRAGLVERAEDWRWGSLWRRHNAAAAGDGPTLAEWPIVPPADWSTHVNKPQTRAELEAFRSAMGAGQPFGEDEWARMILGVLGQSPRRPRGRPRKCPQKMTSDPI